ncbi:MAG: tetratricopeptide repeat protein [Anaerolineales bacterium]|nr:tetratricopeptide repeat protein [Anaerolineales bacterium]
MNWKKPAPIILLCLAILACNLPPGANPAPTDPAATIPAITLLPGETPGVVPTSTQNVPPTLEPGARIASGDRAFFDGDWDKAISEYQLVLDSISDPELQAAALLGLGKSRFQLADYPGALSHLRTLIDTHPQSPKLPYAYFSLGQVYYALQRYTEAADAFQQYINSHPGLIDVYAQELRGDALSAAGNYTGAISAYQAATSAPQLNENLELHIKIGNNHALAGNYNDAIISYNYVFERTANDYTKARMDLYRGQAHVALGLNDQAYAFYLHTVENYPLSYDSYTALVELVDANIAVSDLDRGLVDYYAGQYGVAISAFDRYIQANPDNADDTPYHFKALSLLSAGEPEMAIAVWDEIITNRPFGTYWTNAVDEKAHTTWTYLNQPEQGIQIYLDFVNNNPTQPRAGEFLYFAARIAENTGDLATAAALWSRIGSDYPASEYGFDGFFQAGIAYFRIQDFANATLNFEGALGLAANPGEQSRAYFWIAKSQQAAGNANDAVAAYQQAAATDPTGYYSERANDLLAGRAPFALPASYNLSYDIEAERTEAENWIIATFGLSTDTNLRDLTPILTDPRMIRGTELLELALYNQARLEFESLRISLQSDAANSYRLANYLIDIGLYRSGIIAARQVLTLAGMDDAATMNAPIYFNRLRFGNYYWDLIVPISQSYGFHPLFMFSVVRQESLFEGFVTSSAGARGLMQIVPTTGQSVANKLGWPANYSGEDLYRPIVSLNFGTDYLSTQMGSLGNDQYAALAAYNGGPGNAAEWNSLAGGDQDLFLEVVRFSETRSYIRGIYEIYTIYRNLYGE